MSTQELNRVSQLNLYGKDTGKQVTLIADNNKFKIISEFDKTVVEDLHVQHNGADLSVSSKFSSIDTSIATEQARAEAKEQELQTEYTALISAEETRALTKESLLSTEIDTNKTLAQTNLEGATQALTELISAEETRATTAESDLQQSLANEVTRATTKESELQNSVDVERARAQSAEGILTTSISSEKDRAILAESNLQQSLADEVTRATTKEAELDAKDTELTTLLNVEVTRATNEDQALATLISEESARAQAAEQTERNRAMTKEAQLQTSINNILSNVDPAALDSLTEVVSRINDVDSSAFSRILHIEEYIKNLFNLESLYPLKVSDMRQLVLDIASSAQVFPDEQPPVYNENGGWSFQNTTAGSKINWYFVGQQTDEHKTLEDYSGLYAKVKLHSVSSLPFFNIYTKHKGDGSDAGSWYGSRRTFVFPVDHGLSPEDEVLMYYGTDLPATYPDIPHVALVLDPGSSNGTDDNSQELLTVAFGTNSGAIVDQVNLCVGAFIYGDGKHTHMELTSSPPPPSTEITINTTPGAYPTELWASITTGEDGSGDVIWSQGTSKFVNPGPLTNVVTSVPNGVQLYFNAYDTWGDGWNGATYSITLADGTIVSNNDGMSPNEAGELAGSFGFIV